MAETEFTYEMKNAPNANADVPTSDGPISFRARWQVRRLTYERNLLDLYAVDANSALPPHGLVTFAAAPTPTNPVAAGPPFMFPQAVIRDNVFRHIDSKPAELPSGTHIFGVRMLSAENSLLEGNVFDLSDPHLIHFAASQRFSAFNNRIPAGAVLPMFEDTVGGGTCQFALPCSDSGRRAAHALLPVARDRNRRERQESTGKEEREGPGFRSVKIRPDGSNGTQETGNGEGVAKIDWTA